VLLRLTALAWLALQSVAVAAPGGVSIPEFLRDLCSEYEGVYMERHSAEYAALCEECGLASSSEANRRAFSEVGLLHDMLMGDGAANCVRGGALGIPYFWHWVEPNPRHSIVLLPDSIPLPKVPPPAGYAKYASLADVDRTPALFLSDLVSASPQYWHRGCGSFFTFGWCSEREMAFLALMTSLGYSGRIRQEGIHSWTELRCSMAGRQGGDMTLVAVVDNTFGSLEWMPAPAGVSSEAWLGDVGDSHEARWYNTQARSARQHERLSSTTVAPEAAERMTVQVRRWLGVRAAVSEPGPTSGGHARD